jgi:hypothetical protein
MKSETVPKVFVTLKGVTPHGVYKLCTTKAGLKGLKMDLSNA